MLVLGIGAVAVFGKVYKKEVSSETNWPSLKTKKNSNRVHEFRDLEGGKRQLLLGPEQ